MTLLKSSTCCLNVGSVKWVDGPLELCLLNEILVYKWNFYVFTRELVLINKINMSFAHDWVIINLGQGEWWLGAILCMPPPPTHTVHCWSHGYAYSALLITWVREVMCHSALQLQCERTSNLFSNFLPWPCPPVLLFVYYN